MPKVPIYSTNYVYRIDANTTASRQFFEQMSTFWGKYLITTVKFESNSSRHQKTLDEN